jgi:putative phosphoesterase
VGHTRELECSEACGRFLNRGCGLKIIVVSDTHGNIGGLRQAVRDILSTGDIDLFIHLGDDYDDAGVFEEFEQTYLRVPGVFSSFYADRSVPNRRVEDLQGWRFLLTHTVTSHANDLPDDLKPEALIAGKQVDAVLYGHTHRPELADKNGILFVNPGHLKTEDKKGHSASYAILDISGNEIKGRIVELAGGRTLEEIEFKRV